MTFQNKKIHLVGVKGVGMTALAQILIAKNAHVTGSDGSEVFFTDEVLKSLGIQIQKYSAENITDNLDLVISSAAYYFDGKAQGDNPEIKAALEKKIQILTYPETLGELAKDYKVIAIAGTHGKSTTTAMLGWILDQTKNPNLDPTVLVGTMVKGWNSNARVGEGQYLVVEADEYRDAFLHYKPHGLIITSIDHDHPDYFKTKEDYINSFKKLIEQTDPKGWIIGCDKYEEVRALLNKAAAAGRKVHFYGQEPKQPCVNFYYGYRPWQISDGGQPFRAYICYGDFVSGHSDGQVEEFKINFPGETYMLNAIAAIAAAQKLGIPLMGSSKALSSFPGTRRRFEILEKTAEYVLIDDYAHHPTEIQKTLEGARKFYLNQKIIAIFQPHTFSRTKLLLEDFAKSFKEADEVGIMPVYASAREAKGDVGSKELAEQAQKYHSNVTYLKDRKAAVNFLREKQKNQNVILLMGAGDVGSLWQDL